ncbi:hypothetical protein MKW94_006170 [Papaver nudicaule]|uniref:Uncharacterized protein n=1 Tax=Papaver nudicaule TaxID=74823 RepID=A0AA41W353_PAPNU|nr:hypothetical protein [Papaver nudicaule]
MVATDFECNGLFHPCDMFTNPSLIFVCEFSVDNFASLAGELLKFVGVQKIVFPVHITKLNNVDVVYTPWYNLKKTASMDVGQIGLHNSKMVRTVRVEKRINEVVNRLNKTKVERTPDLKAEREAVNAAERAESKLQLRDKEEIQQQQQALVVQYL